MALACVLVPLAGSWVRAGAREAFPDPRPATRAAAVALVAGETQPALGCLTPQIQGLADSRLGSSPAARRALAMLQQRPYAGAERYLHAADGTPVGFTDSPGAFDRVAPADGNADGTPDLVERVIEGLGQARSLLVDRLDLPRPQGLDVVLLELGPSLEGYLVGGDDSSTIVLDGWPGADPDAVRLAAAHQYAHAVAQAAGPQMPREWSEALATWTTLAIEGEPDGVVAGLLASRLDRMDEGLLSRDIDLAAGNAIWLVFLEQSYGAAAVSVTVQELASGGGSPEALDRALRRVSGDGLAAAFREFQLWSILVGSRADRFHFSFAERLSDARFASTADGLPVLSVQADPAIAPWGAAQIRIVPGDGAGGMGLRFEGEIGARWEADLVLIDETGAVRRLALAPTSEGLAESMVPLDQAAEAILLVRNVGSIDGSSHRYTYAAYRERGWPMEMTSFEAVQRGRTVDVSWETASERDLVGFNILRSRFAGGVEQVVNPVWIPALGEPNETTSYQFADRDADPGASWVYRIQAITTDGLSSFSAPQAARAPGDTP